VKVSLAPQLAAKLAANSVLFVYARNPSGPPMPLAVTRLPASALPATVTLTDAMSMAPGMNLSSAQQVIIGARLSARGQALPQPGDLEGSVGPVAVNRTQPINIVIDKIVRQ
jgi:cytochrome c-type biogenesis protein CcmH